MDTTPEDPRPPEDHEPAPLPPLEDEVPDRRRFGAARLAIGVVLVVLLGGGATFALTRDGKEPKAEGVASIDGSEGRTGDDDPSGGDGDRPSQQEMEDAMLAYAKCMREQGIDGFPDPKPDGTFPLLGTPLENEGKSERVLTALEACKHLYDKKIALS